MTIIFVQLDSFYFNHHISSISVSVTSLTLKKVVSKRDVAWGESKINVLTKEKSDESVRARQNSSESYACW